MKNIIKKATKLRVDFEDFAVKLEEGLLFANVDENGYIVEDIRKEAEEELVNEVRKIQEALGINTSFTVGDEKRNHPVSIPEADIDKRAREIRNKYATDTEAIILSWQESIRSIFGHVLELHADMHNCGSIVIDFVWNYPRTAYECAMKADRVLKWFIDKGIPKYVFYGEKPEQREPYPWE